MPNLLVTIATITTTRAKRRPIPGHDVHIKKRTFGVTLGHNSIRSIKKKGKENIHGGYQKRADPFGSNHSPTILVRS